MKKKNRINFFTVIAVLGFLISTLQTPVSARNENKVEAPLSAQNDNPGLLTDQIIIKYKAGTDAFLVPAVERQMQRLDSAGGVHLQFFRAMSDDSQVLKLPSRFPLQQVYDITDKLEKLPEVEYAEPDHLLRPALTPNDPRYADQWALWDSWGIDAPAAWDVTTGSGNIVVADIDTGITNHVDLNGRMVSGYDFVSDAQIANDGNGRDNDPSDPGDWITLSESNNPSSIFYGCPVSDSSWHGTHTAGTIGATGNNSIGITGINWVSKILPVRVLGKCGGYSSDIVDGMRWAAGLYVSGAPVNPNPAKVLNLSLGSVGACSITFQTAVNQITAAGAVVVVAAGNSGANAGNFEPANCNNVISVAATGQSGSLAYYSNYGPSVKVSAPGGDITIDNGILSTLNTGTTVPVSGTYGYYQGTSMAAPHVTGVVSLMFSLDPALTPPQILQIIQSTAKAFPGGSTCNTMICGAGIVDAGAAIQGVLGLRGVSISGNVGVTGVVLSYTDGLKTVASQSDGSYTITVPYGWSGTVTPSDTCFTFSPPNRSYDNLAVNQIVQNYSNTLKPSCADVNVSVSGSDQGSYIVPQGSSARVSYVSLDSGPVQIASTTGTDIIASERVAYTPDGGLTWPSFSELMGLPTNQLTDTYVMPWYNNVEINSQLRFGNVGNTSTTVTVTVGGVVQGTYPLAVNQSLRVSYAGLNNGPVEIKSSGGVPIVASERVAYTPDGGLTWPSFSELMGFPTNQLTDTYVMPWYNNVEINSQLRFGNVGNTSTTVTVTVGGVVQGTYPLAVNQSLRVSYAGLNNGPVEIKSSGGVPIVASERVAYTPNGGLTWTSFSELMGFPTNQLTDTYVMPWYNNVEINSQLRFGNVGNTDTTITVKVGSVFQGAYLLSPNESLRVSYAGLNNGPVEIKSSGGVPIVASERVAYTPNGGLTWPSFSELMGFPSDQLTDTYVMPWYNNVEINSQLRFGMP